MDDSKRRGLTTIDMVYVGLSAALITIFSWISIPMTIPFTLQTMGVCLVAGIFGFKRGTLAILTYIALGAIGVPVFTGFKGGIGALLGSTGGYILGFVFTALIVGFVSDRRKGDIRYVLPAMVLGIAVLYTFGTLWFAFVYARTSDPAPLSAILGWCVLPFIIPDAVKITFAAILTTKLRRFVTK